jgi:thiamine biosynthesis lipoprotein
MRQLGRRRFLYLIAGGASAGLASSLLRDGDESEPKSGRELHRVRRSSWALGSTVTMTALHDDEAAGKTAIDAAFHELELVEALMSIYRPESQLSRLNRDRVLLDPHPYFIEVLQAARTMSRRTDGAFDLTIQPLWDLYASAQQTGELPSAAAIREARALVDWRRVEIGSSQVRLHRDGTAITLNGIAQGFAADRVTATLRAHGVRHALIDTGEISAWGAKQKGDAWTIGIQHPREVDSYVSLAKLAGRCLATSGDYATTFSSDFKHHHLLDPRTGQSPEELSSVSIAAKTALQADAMSTAALVMGAEVGLELVKQTPGADAMFVSKDGRATMTDEFPLVQG